MKRVYTFGDGKAEGKASDRNLLGGKGANLAEMNLLGMPVPPGFTITTEVCTEYTQYGRDEVVKRIQKEVEAAVAHVEVLTGKKFNDPSGCFVAFPSSEISPEIVSSISSCEEGISVLSNLTVKTSKTISASAAG